MSAEVTGTDWAAIITAVTGAITTILGFLLGHKKGVKTEKARAKKAETK